MIVTESDGSRKFQLAFDMRGFEPEEVKIKTQNGALIISAKKEKKV
jgi:HSP20 family molecular chaperone IbpA